MSLLPLPAPVRRRFRAAPGSALFSVVMLATGIAAVTCAIAVIRAVFGPPGGVADADRLVTVSATPIAPNVRMAALSWPDFADLRERQTSLSGLVGFVPVQLLVAADGVSRFGTGELVTTDYFDVLGVVPLLGRTFTPADETPQAPAVIVISHFLWRLLGSDPAIVGHTLHVNGRPFTVVGVAPRPFAGLFANGRTQALLWAPLAAVEAFPLLGWNERSLLRDVPMVFVRGRIAGDDLAPVEVELAHIARYLDEVAPLPDGAGARRWVARRTADVAVDEVIGRVAPSVAGLVLTAAVLVLLVVCSNVGNLTIARNTARRHEFATRFALGASRWQLVRETGVELAFVAGAGGVLALLLTVVVLHLVRPLEVAGGVIAVIEPRLDAVALLSGATAWVASVLVAGVVPAWLVARDMAPDTLFGGTPAAVVPRWRRRLWLIGLQIVVSVVLLSTASLFLAQAARRAREGGGLELDRFALAEIDFDMQYVDPQRAGQIVDRVLEQLALRPGVGTAAVGSGLPFGMATTGARLRRRGQERAASVVAVTPRYFDAIGLRLAHGRAFSSEDSADADAVAVIDARLARALFGRDDVVGEQVEIVPFTATHGSTGPVSRRIVGVTAAVEGFPGGGALPTLYVPWARAKGGRVAILARGPGGADALAGEIRSAVAAVDGSIGVLRSGSGRALLVPARGLSVAVGLVSTLLGGAGLIVVLVGLYGMLSAFVTGRAQELALRLALGAPPSTVMLAVVKAGMTPVVGGMAAAGGVVLAGRQFLLPRLTTLLPEARVEGIAVVAVLLLATSLLACWLPARRAARIDPAATLRR